MKQSVLILMMMLWAGTSWGQITIGEQNFDGTTTLGYTNNGGTTYSGSSTNNDRPANSSFSVSPTTAFGISNGTAILTFANTSGLSAYVDKYFEFKLASWSISSTGNGADVADIATIAISTDDGITWSDEIKVLGNSNAYWDYSSGSGNATVTYDGDNSPTDFKPAAGGSRTTDGYSTVRVNLPNAGSQARLKITLKNNAASERWTIDDIKLVGTLSTPTVSIANSGTPAASDITQGTNDVVLFGFSLTPSASVDFTAVSIATTGTATTSDLSNFELVYDADSDGVYDGGESIVSDQLALANPLSFTMSGQTGIAAERRYLLIADVAAGATVGNTFTASIAAASDVTTTGDESGTAAGNQQTIISASAPIITVTGSLSSFGNVAKDSHSASQSYTVAGSNLNDNITITAPTGFAVSTDDVTFSSSVVLTASSGSVSSTTIYVRFSPSTDDGTKTGSITHVSTGATTQNQAVEGFAIASEPTTAASSLNFTSVTENSFTINWTRGNGDSVLVIMKSGSAVDFDPSDGTEYTANATFGSGTELGSGNYVVYNGTGTSVAVTGLTASTTYHVEVFEYNYGSATGTENYNVTSTLTGSEVTLTPPEGLQISSTNTNFVIDFESTVSGVNNGTFTAAGFAPNPTSGQLDSDAWSVTGMSDGNVDFGGTGTTGDNARGESTGGVTTGGVYAFNTGSNTILGFQPGGSDWKPGTVILRIQNQTGSSINRLNISYVIWVLNDQGRSSNFNLSYSYNNSSYFNVSELDFTTTEVADGSPAWTSYSKFTTIYSLDIADQAYFYLRWSSNDVGGSGSRDEFGIDDITINVNSTDNKRQITGTAGWRMLSSPKSGFTVSDISDDTAIQGVAGGPNSDGFVSNFYYFGSTGAWTTPTNVNTPFGDGYGFIVKFFNNTEAGSSTLPLTLDIAGTEPSGDVVVNLNKTVMSTGSVSEGTAYWTLLGNPFASNINLSSLTVNEDTLGASVQVWDNVASDYDVVTNASGTLAPWQGFWAWVKGASTATQVTIPQSAKTASASTVSNFKTASSSLNGMFTVSQAEFESKPFQLVLHDKASLGLDIYDASKLTPLSETYIAVAGRQVTNTGLKAIESLPMELNQTVEMFVSPMIVGYSGEFMLNWNSFESMSESYSITLFDAETNESYNLRDAGSIAFSIEAPITKAKVSTDFVMNGGSDRFKLVIAPITTSAEIGTFVPTQVELAQNFPNPFNPSTTIQYAIPAQSNVRLAVYDMLGREVSLLVAGKTQAAGRYEVQFDASALSSGMYLYRLEAGSTVITKKLTLIK